MKNSFTLLEVLLSTLIAAIIFVSSIYYLKDLVSFNTNTLNKEIRNLDLLSTKIFLQKNNDKLEDKLNIKNSTLFFGNSKLLDDVLYQRTIKNESFYEIKLKTKKQELVWIIKRDETQQ